MFIYQRNIYFIDKYYNFLDYYISKIIILYFIIIEKKNNINTKIIQYIIQKIILNIKWFQLKRKIRTWQLLSNMSLLQWEWNLNIRMIGISEYPVPESGFMDCFFIWIIIIFNLLQ